MGKLIRRAIFEAAGQDGSGQFANQNEDFESCSLDSSWSVIQPEFKIYSDYAKGSCSAGITGESLTYIDAAEWEPSYLDGGKQIDSFSYRFLIGPNNHWGHHVMLRDSNDDPVVGAGSDSLKPVVSDGQNLDYPDFDATVNREQWVDVALTFDWDTETCSYTFDGAGVNLSGNFGFTNTTNVAKVVVQNTGGTEHWDGENLGGDADFRIDDLKLK